MDWIWLNSWTRRKESRIMILKNAAWLQPKSTTLTSAVCSLRCSITWHCDDQNYESWNEFPAAEPSCRAARCSAALCTPCSTFRILRILRLDLRYLSLTLRPFRPLWTHVNTCAKQATDSWQSGLTTPSGTISRMDRCQNSGKGRLYRPDRLQIAPPTVEQVCSHFAPECTSEVHATSVCGNTCCCNTCTVSAMISLAGRTWEIAVQCWSTVWTDHWNIGNMQLLHPRFNTLELHSPHFTSITIAKLLTIGILLGYLIYDQTGMMKYDEIYPISVLQTSQ